MPAPFRELSIRLGVFSSPSLFSATEFQGSLPISLQEMSSKVIFMVRQSMACFLKVKTSACLSRSFLTSLRSFCTVVTSSGRWFQCSPKVLGLTSLYDVLLDLYRLNQSLMCWVVCLFVVLGLFLTGSLEA